MTNQTSQSDPVSGNAPTTGNSASADNAITRRPLLKTVTAGILSVLLGAVPFVAGLLFFLDPLFRRKSQDPLKSVPGGVQKDADGFIKLDVNVDTLDEGKPVDVTVYDDKVDAWNKFLHVPVGKVWLRKTDAGKILAFNVICPHLGCSVSYRQTKDDFYCPCHLSAFNLDGRRQNEIPPRHMDELKIKRKSNGVDDRNGSEIWIRFQNFRKAEPTPIPV